MSTAMTLPASANKVAPERSPLAARTMPPLRARSRAGVTVIDYEGAVRMFDGSEKLLPFHWNIGDPRAARVACPLGHAVLQLLELYYDTVRALELTEKERDELATAKIMSETEVRSLTAELRELRRRKKEGAPP
jgi:hypothetical protein